jgi:hypothetical protein
MAFRLLAILSLHSDGPALNLNLQEANGMME